MLRRSLKIKVLKPKVIAFQESGDIYFGQDPPSKISYRGHSS